MREWRARQCGLSWAYGGKPRYGEFVSFVAGAGDEDEADATGRGSVHPA